jgi:hypothetical protein
MKRILDAEHGQEKGLAMDIMSEPAGQYASEEEREWTAGVLRTNQAAGRLTVTELEERLKKAYASRTIGELRETVANLPPPDPGEGPPPDAPPMARPSYEGFRARRRQERGSRGLLGLAVAYAATMVMLVGIWLFSGMGNAWFVWPMLAGGIALAARATTLLGGSHQR